MRAILALFLFFVFSALSVTTSAFAISVASPEYKCVDCPVGPIDGSSTSSSIFLPETVESCGSSSSGVLDVNVSVQVATTWRSDVELSLLHVPSGTTVLLIEDIGPGEDDLNVLFNDSAPNPISDCLAGECTGNYRPLEALAAFEDLDPAGEWRLLFSDNFPADPSTLANWSLEATLLDVDLNGVPDCFGSGVQVTKTCAEFGSNCNDAIPVPGGDFTFSTINIPNECEDRTDGTIYDLNVQIDIDHDWIGDMDAALWNSESIIGVGLFANVANTFPGSQKLDVILEDSAIASVSDCIPGAPCTGFRRSESNLLSNYNGFNAEGTWRLSIADPIFPGDTGQLNSWSLIYTLVDLDSDGTPDCTDQCKADPNKTVPGPCGCGSVEEDIDNDGIADCIDDDASVDASGTCVGGGTDCIFRPLAPTAQAGVNSFLGQINIASVINVSGSNLAVTVEYVDLLGNIVGTVDKTLAPGIKEDFIINDLGLGPDTVGTARIITDASSNGEWIGGVTIYKPDSRQGLQPFGTGFDFALYYPFANPQTGVSTVPLNTFHIGTNPQALVANWIAISDAERDGRDLKGSLEYFDDQGNLLSSDSVAIADGGRADFPGHIGVGGINNNDALGMARFTPENKPGGASPLYQMNVTRYFYDCVGLCNNFLSAFNLPTRPATMGATGGGISTADSEISIIELINTSGSNADVGYTVVSEAGALVGSQSVSIPPLGNRSIIINQSGSSGFFADNTVGAAGVVPVSGTISALSLFYKLDPATGALLYGYAAPFVGSGREDLVAQFNSFISHQTTAEVINPLPSTISGALKATTVSGVEVLNIPFSINGNSTLRLPNLTLPLDTYGTVLVDADNDGLLVRTYVERKDSYKMTFVGE